MSNGSDEGLETDTNSTTSVRRTDFIFSDVYQAVVFLWKTWPPCLLLIGGFGNMATICVMRRIKDHNSSQYTLLMSLAVCDLFLLSMGGVRSWLNIILDLDMRMLHIVVCKAHVWWMYSFGTSSAWLVTCVTVQRTMAVLWPHRMKAAWTGRRTWMVVAAVVLTSFLFHVHLVPGMEITGTRCDGVPGPYLYFFRYVYMWVDMSVSSFLPFVCQLVCDVILSVTLFQAASSSSSASSSLAVHATSSMDSRKRMASKTTVLVLSVSCTFLVLTLPVGGYLLWYTYKPVSRDVRAVALEELGYAVTMFLWYTNSAVNFLLYCLTGTRFRREFLDWILCRGTSSATACVGEVDSGSSSEQRHGRY